MSEGKSRNPIYYVISPTHRCQSRCRTCSGWQTPSSVEDYELSTDEWKKIIKSMREDFGVFDFVFSGGEPLLRRDCIEIADYAASIGVMPKIITNALALRSYEDCRRLFDSSIDTITISLNAVKDPSVHNHSRGREDAFRITMNAIQNLTSLNRRYKGGKTILLATVVMPTNYDELVPLAEFIKTEGIGINYQMMDNGDAFFAAKCREFDGEFGKELYEKATKALDNLKELKQRGYLIYNTEDQLESFKSLIPKPSEINPSAVLPEEEKRTSWELPDDYDPYYHDGDRDEDRADIPENIQCSKDSCKIGYRNFTIDPFGNVRICFSMEPIGSLREATPLQIWTGRNAMQRRNEIYHCDKPCKYLNCNYSEDEE